MGSSRPINPEALGADIADHLNLFIDAAQERPTFAVSGNLFEELCRHYRALGICVAVAEADMDAFFHWLIQSGIARRYYLEGIAREGGGEPHYRRMSFVDPMLDAVAARQWKLAADILRLSSPSWLPGEEYEDDFLYGEAWRLLLAGDRTKLAETLIRWKAVLEGGDDLRLDLCQAYAGGDPSVFADALRALLTDIEARARVIADPRRDSLQADDYPFHPNRWISIEGLAFLSLAERDGMAIEGDFPACQPSARTGEYVPYEPMAYPPIELT